MKIDLPMSLDFFWKIDMYVSNFPFIELQGSSWLRSSAKSTRSRPFAPHDLKKRIWTKAAWRAHFICGGVSARQSPFIVRAAQVSWNTRQARNRRNWMQLAALYLWNMPYPMSNPRAHSVASTQWDVLLLTDVERVAAPMALRSAPVK